MDETLTLHLPKHGDFTCGTFSFNTYYAKDRSVLMADVLDITGWDVADVTGMLKVELAIVAADLKS